MYYLAALNASLAIANLGKIMFWHGGLMCVSAVIFSGAFALWVAVK